MGHLIGSSEGVYLGVPRYHQGAPGKCRGSPGLHYCIFPWRVSCRGPLKGFSREHILLGDH
jgi:hypothetical protein